MITPTKRLLALLIFSALNLLADQLIRPLGPYLTLGTDLVPGGSLNNTWVFQPLNPNQGICIFAANKHVTDPTTLTLNVYQTGSPLIPQYTGFEFAFREDSVQGAISPVPAKTTNTGFVQTSAAARVAIRISSSSGGGPVDLHVVQTTAGSCGPVQSGSNTIQGSTPIGSTLSSNPITIAGIDSSNIVRPYAAILTATNEYAMNVTSWATCTVYDPIPTSDTLLINNNRTRQLTIANTTSSVINLTITTNDPTPKPVLTSAPINPKSTYVMQWPYLLFTSGLRWSASATGLYGQWCGQ